MAVCAQDFPWQPPAGPARRAPPGALGWGKAHASAPAEDELYSHFHTCASHFPAAEECGGGLPQPPQPSGRLGASFGTRQCRAGTVDFSSPDPRVINVIAEGAGGGRRAPSKHVADGPGGAVPAVGPW